MLKNIRTLFRKNTSSSDATSVIEEAVLLGHVKEIDQALELIKNNDRISDDLRYGLEALRYFRAYYGKGGEIEPTDPLQKQKAIVLETAWGSELLDKLKTNTKETEAKQV